ncbi:MAG: hypothetical protein FWG83_07510 [Oscillospiraceae bacterium]|nr:hypothetical protein [Oscillospiraceae bacterium]
MDKVKESFSKTFISVKEKWGGLAGRTRVVILAATGAVLVSAIIITLILNRPEQAILCKAGSAEEVTQIQVALAAANITDVQVTRNNEIIVPDNVKGAALVALSEAGLPRPGQNTDVYDSGIGMFSTDREHREKQKHQLEEDIRGYLREIPEVSTARVNLTIPETKNFVMIENRAESRASVAVTLNKPLSRKQINGIHNYILNAVPDLKLQNISVTDGSGIPLIVTDGEDDDAAAALALQQQRLAMEVALKIQVAEDARDVVVPFLDKILGSENYAFSVSAKVNTSDDHEVELVEYTPIVGLDGGIARDILEQFAAGYTSESGQPLGTFLNSDIAPDYPTLTDIQAGNEVYTEFQRKINYEINERRESFRNNGLRIDEITASLVINSENIPLAEEESWKELIAQAVGTSPDNVAFATRVFTLQPSPLPTTPGSSPADTLRKWLIFVLIAIVVLIVIQVLLAVLTSGKRKRVIRYRGAVTADGGYIRDDSYQPLSLEPEGFDLPSLLDDNETKDVVLKREIKEFSKSNPEIIAQLIRTWFREDES